MLLPLKDLSVSAGRALEAQYSPEERKRLLRLAHDSIAAAILGREVELRDGVWSGRLSEPRGAFTSLYLSGQLRGCVGYPTAVRPLYRTVSETAVAAAINDPRFPPVNDREAPHLVVSISVLSALFSITPEKVEVGVHGLVVSQGSRRGLLLPQVPVNFGWDQVTFLEQTCYKAGLPADAWKHAARLQAFTAEVFGDDNQEH